MRRTRIRVGLFSLACVLLLAATGVTSYMKARDAAAAAIGPLSPGVRPVGVGLIPLRRTATGQWVWAFAYGPGLVPGHVGFEVHVSLFRSTVATNPPDALSRLHTGENRRPAS